MSVEHVNNTCKCVAHTPSTIAAYEVIMNIPSSLQLGSAILPKERLEFSAHLAELNLLAQKLTHK